VPEKPDKCACAICALKIDFELDPYLLSEIEKYNCAIFAGAGISTEAKRAHPDTLYDALKAEVGSAEDLIFPALVDRFESRPNGRQSLISLLIERFAYIDGFRELRGTATRFHRELSTMPYLSPLITTNWDRYFEEECGATPFVYESDVPFWEVAKRPLLKIHGSVDNYASIVASTADYVACEQRLREGALGAVLKQLFATKTLIFCGYSATDPDFLNLFNIIQTGLGAFARTHYLISPFVTEDDTERLAALNIIPIRTDASYFLEVVKEHMCEKFCFSRDFSYAFIGKILKAIIEKHFSFTRSYRPGKAPHLIFSTVYQDGLIHAFQRILDLAHTGEYADLHKVRAQVGLYEDKIEGLWKARDYYEVSYFTGYLSGLAFFDLVNTCDAKDLPSLPPFFHPGVGHIVSDKEFDRLVRNNPTVHKSALKQAQRIVNRAGAADAEVIQHLPWG
jgi:hypothetical protein